LSSFNQVYLFLPTRSTKNGPGGVADFAIQIFVFEVFTALVFHFMETVGRWQLPAAMFDLSLPAATFDLSLLVVNSGAQHAQYTDTRARERTHTRLHANTEYQWAIQGRRGKRKGKGA